MYIGSSLKILLVCADLRINSNEFSHILHHTWLKIKPESIKSFPDCNKDGTQAFWSNYELQRQSFIKLA
jgi:hypothetical protein